MKTYYRTTDAGHARYWYDPYLRMWTVYAVTSPDEEGFQLGEADYAITRAQAKDLAAVMAGTGQIFDPNLG